MKKTEQFNIEKYYELYRKNGYYDEMFFDFSIKQYEANILIDELNKVNPKFALVIGAFKGLSSLLILLENKNNERIIYCIDPFFDSYYAGDNYRHVYDHMIGLYDVDKKIITIKGFATIPGKEVFELTKDNSMAFDPCYWFTANTIKTKMDLILIDGDHSYEAALADFVVSYQMLSRSGVILIHDTCDNLWKNNLNKLLHYIKNIPSLEIKEYKGGVNGITVVKRKS